MAARNEPARPGDNPGDSGAGDARNTGANPPGGAPAGGDLGPPALETGIAGWLRANLFSTWYNSLLTGVTLALLLLALWFGLRWIIVDADWTVISVLGGRMVIGQYNTEAACPGQNCFWRPQVSLLLVSMLLGMAWAVAGGGVAKRIAILVAVVLAAFALLPYRLETMGWDVRLLLVANVPATLLGWAVAHYLGWSARGAVIFAIASFLITLVLLRGLPGVPGLQPVSVINWGGLKLNLLLAVAGIVLSLPIGIALALGRRSSLPLVKQ